MNLILSIIIVLVIVYLLLTYLEIFASGETDDEDQFEPGDSVEYFWFEGKEYRNGTIVVKHKGGFIVEDDEDCTVELVYKHNLKVAE